MNSTQDISLDFLVAECKRSNRLAQKKVFDLYSASVYSSALRITGNTMDAQDITQEAFIDAFNKIDSFTGSGNFVGWLKRIAINKSLNFVKRHRMYTSDLNENINEEDDNNYEEPEYTIEMVNQAVQQLSDGYRMVFNLFAFEGYSHREIADQLGITESTSKSQYNRAKARIRQLVTESLQHG